MLGIFDRFLGENRAVSFQTIWASGGDLEIGTQSGVAINADTAFRVNAVFSAVSLISDTISTLPVDSYIRRDGARFPFRPRPAWVTKPDVDTTKEAFYGSIIVSLLLDGNAFVRVYSNSRGEVVNLVVLNPMKVEIERNGLGRVMFRVEGEEKLLSSEQVIFIPDVVRPGHIRGISRVEALKDNFGLAMALENYAARFFGQGATTQGIIEYPGKLTQVQAEELRESFDNRHKGWRRSHRTGILSNGAKYVQTSVDPEKSQALDARRMAVEDVARAFNVPPHLLGLPGTTSYASVEQNNLAWVTHSLRPIVQKLETALSPLLARSPGGENAFLKFSLDGLLRADINSRMSAYSVGLQSGFLTINDVRRLEDLTPIADESADTVRVPLANVNVSAATLSETTEKVDMASKLVQVGFDPVDVLRQLELPPMAHTGLPSVQLQPIAQIDETNPESAYEVE
ncbi:MAG: phage portal protein [Actinobacteria bacterium]|nr:phage portal protein [Actinomycetota bacterium]